MALDSLHNHAAIHAYRAAGEASMVLAIQAFEVFAPLVADI